MSGPKQNGGKVPGATSSSGQADTQRKRVLLAEADGFTRLVMILLFRIAGLKVDFTSNGTLALGKLKSSCPDALLVELKLGGVSGLELIRAARQDPQFQGLPIYVFTQARAMNRATRKEVEALATQVFDKEATSIESLVKTVATDLGGFAPELLSGSPLDISRIAPAEELIMGAELQQIVDGVRVQAEELVKCSDGRQRLERGGDLLGRVSDLVSCAEAAGSAALARQAKALQAFLERLCNKAKQIPDGALSTVRRAIEVLTSLSAAPSKGQDEPVEYTAAVLDESAPSSRVLSAALRDAGLTPVSFESPAEGLKQLTSRHVDLIVVNVPQPQLHGLDTESLRKLHHHANTPILYVPELAAAESPVQGAAVKANAQSTSPLLPAELGLKALNAVQGKPEPTKRAPAPPSRPLPPPTLAAQQFIIASNQLTGHQTPAAAPARPAAIELQAADLFQPPRHLPPPPRSRRSARSERSLVNPGPLPVPEPLLAHAEDASAPGRSTVLFIEDDPFVVKVYRRALKRAGFKVEVAEDGLAALEVLPRLKPELVVLDLMLPKINGLDVLKFIRTEENLKRIPVVVLSNAYLDQMPIKAKEAGANQAIAKADCTPVKLVELACELLGGSPSIALTPTSALVPGHSTDADLNAETAIWVRQAGLRKAAPKEVARIRQECLSYIKSANAEESLQHLMELYRQVRFLSAHAALIGFTKIAEVSSALEGLLFEIIFKEYTPTTPTFQTIAQAVDLLDRLVQNNDTTFPEPRLKPKVLVVDDDAVCNFAFVNALKRANFDATGVQDPVQSLQVLAADCFNLVLLDINMPHLDGFQVCEQLRRMPQYKAVPVVFISVNVEFRVRARTVIAGGNDLIAKPLSPLELILKTTMHLLSATGQNIAGGKDAEQAPRVRSVEEVFNEQQAQTAPAESSVPTELGDALAVACAAEAAALQNAAATAAIPVNQLEAQSGAGAEVHATTAVSEERQDAVLQPVLARSETTMFARVVAPMELPTGEEQTAGATEATVIETVPGPQGDSQSPAASNRVAAAPGSPNGNGEHDAQPAPEVEALQAECAKQREAVAKYERERENLVNRIVESENNAHRAEARLKKRDLQIEQLQKQLAEATAGKPSPDSAQAAQANLESNGDNPATADAAAQVALLEQELTSVRQAREELNARFLKEQQLGLEATQRLNELETQLAQRAADFERTRTELEQKARQQADAEAELRRQLAAAGEAAGTKQNAEQQQAQSRIAQLEQELIGARQSGEQLKSQLTQQHQAQGESAKRAQELEELLTKRLAELDGTRNELEQQTKEHATALSGLRQQLESADAAARKADAAQAQAWTRCDHLEQQLAGLRQAGEKLRTELQTQQEAGAAAERRIKDLEAQLKQQADAAQHAHTTLDTRTKEKAAVESDLRKQLEAAEASAKRHEQTHTQAQSRVTQLEKEVAGLRQAADKLGSQFATEQQANAQGSKRVKELETLLAERTAELQKNAGEHGRVEAELRSRLEAANAGVRQRKDLEVEHEQLAQQMAALRDTRDTLAKSLGQEQRATADLRQRVKELEDYLSKRSVEQERAKSELEKEAEARKRAEAKLRSELESTTAEHKQAQSRIAQLETELQRLRQTSEELNGQVAKEHQAGGTARERVKNLEAQLATKATELERAQAELQKQTQTHERAHGDLSGQLAAAATGQKEAQARAAQFEQQLAGLRQAHEELTSRFAKEQQAGVASAKHTKELEAQLAAKATELERAKAELEQQAQTHQRTYSDLSTRLEVGGAAQKEAQARAIQLEQQLSGLRQAHDELTTKFTKEQQAGADSAKRLKDLDRELATKAAELDRAKAELEKQAQTHKRLHADLTSQLDVAGAGQKQTRARAALLEQQLAELRHTQAEVSSRLTKEQQAGTEAAKRLKELESQLADKALGLEQAKADFEKQAQAHNRAHADLTAQLAAATAAQTQGQARAAQLEQQLAALRQAQEESTSKFTKEQQASADSARRLKEIETQLAAKSSDLERAQAELQKQAQAQKQMQSELTTKLDVAGAGHKQAQARVGELEGLLAGLRQAHDELTSKFTKEQQVSADSAKRLKDVEGQLAAKSSDLERAQAQLQQQAQAKKELESELNSKLDVVGAGQKQAQARVAELETRLEQQAQAHQRAQVDLNSQLTAAGAAHKDTQARAAQLEQQLAGLRQAHDEVSSKLTKEQQVGADSAKRLKEIEAQLAAKSSDLERAQAELQKQAQAKKQLEAELSNKLDVVGAGQKQAQARVAELETRLEQQAQAHQRAQVDLNSQLTAAGAAHKDTQARAAQLEQQLAGLRQAHDEVSSKLTKEQQAGADSAKRLKDLERELAARAAELARSKADLEQQAQTHQRAQTELSAQLAAAGAVHKDTQARAAQVEQQLAGLRHAHEELTTKFAQEQQSGAEAAKRVQDLQVQLATKAADLDQSKAALEQQADARKRLEGEMNTQLELAAAAQKQAQTRATLLEEQLAEWRRAHDEARAQLAKEQQTGAESVRRFQDAQNQLAAQTTELARTKADLEQHLQAHQRAHAELTAQLQQANEAHQLAKAQAAQFEGQLAGLRQVHDDVTGRFAKEQQRGDEARTRFKELERHLEQVQAERDAQAAELEQRLCQGVAALTRVTADLARERGERQRCEDRAAALSRRVQELLDESSRLLQAQRAAQERLLSLEAKVQEGNETVARQATEIEQHQAEHRVTQQQLQKAHELNEHFRKQLNYFEEATKSFDLTRQDLQGRLEATLNAVEEGAARLQREVAERQRVAGSLETAQRDLQNQTQRRELVEHELLSAHQARRESEAKLQEESVERQRLASVLAAAQRDLESQSRLREALEKELQATRQGLQETQDKWQQEALERQRLASTLGGTQRDLDTLTSKRQTLETQLQAASQQLQEREARLQQELTERHRVSNALQSSQVDLQTQAAKSRLQVSDLQSSLQLEQAERKRLETQFARLRHFSLASARGARSLRNSLRRQLRDSVDNLHQSARSLLQCQLGDEQKRLAEAILQDTLLVHTRLQETEAPHNGRSEPELDNVTLGK